jgi:hypothetical protein
MQKWDEKRECTAKSNGQLQEAYTELLAIGTLLLCLKVIYAAVENRSGYAIS